MEYLKTKKFISEQINFFMDPGHGWVKVPKDVINELGIKEKITHFSYKKNDFVYLEEDCDASTFLRALEEKSLINNIKDLKINEIVTNGSSIIRTYASY